MEQGRGAAVPDRPATRLTTWEPAAPSVLWPAAAKLHGARFTPKGGFDTAYLASDAITAMMEVKAVLAGPRGLLSPPTDPWVLVSITGVVHGVLDLTDPKVQADLGTSTAELTGAWAYSPGGGPPPTQGPR